MNQTLFTSTIVSLSTQVVLAVLTFGASFVSKVPQDLRVRLILEGVSQVSEFSWYAAVVCFYKEIVTWTRYIDWAWSTPLMIITACFFFLHRRGMSLEISSALVGSLLFNQAMLGFGLAGEWGYLSWKTSVFFGSLYLVASFTLLGTYVDDSDPFSVAFYWSMYVVWGLYGVAFLFPYLYKNISYNYLDVISKNVFGLVLSVYAFTLK